jgi:hypothetical protein
MVCYWCGAVGVNGTSCSDCTTIASTENFHIDIKNVCDENKILQKLNTRFKYKMSPVNFVTICRITKYIKYSIEVNNELMKTESELDGHYEFFRFSLKKTEDSFVVLIS